MSVALSFCRREKTEAVTHSSDSHSQRCLLSLQMKREEEDGSSTSPQLEAATAAFQAATGATPRDVSAAMSDSNRTAAQEGLFVPPVAGVSAAAAAAAASLVPNMASVSASAAAAAAVAAAAAEAEAEAGRTATQEGLFVPPVGNVSEQEALMGLSTERKMINELALKAADHAQRLKMLASARQKEMGPKIKPEILSFEPCKVCGDKASGELNWTAGFG